MTRVAIYARYSSDLQRDASIEDQIRVCTQRAQKEGWQVVQAYTDHGVSGASLMRPGIQILLQDAQAGKYDIVVAEALDRLSRDQEDIAGIYKRMEFAGVKILTLSEGEVSTLHIGLKGTMNAMFLKDLADKTRRGLSGRVEKGKSGGGLTYGYDIVKQMDANGEPVRGDRTINQTEAAVVERIMRDYVAGQSPIKIARQLNAEGIPGPSGNEWGPSTINGNRERGTGILNNELYIGKLVWNRLRYVKNPDTGKRISKLNPPESWIIKDVPELRIVDDELWNAVRAKQGKIKKLGTAFWDRQRPRYLFSGLIKCGTCGGGMTVISQTHIGCATARNKGTCDNLKAIGRDNLEAAVFEALQHHLMDEQLCAEFCTEYVRHMNELRQQRSASLAGYRAEFERNDRQLDKMVDAIANGAPVAKLKDKMWELENRQVVLKELLADAKETPVLFHPNMAKRYYEEVRGLIDGLNDPQHRPEAAEIIRSLIDRIVLTPVDGEKRLSIDLMGDLAGILTMATGRKDIRLEREVADQQVKMVAGAGFEPATFRL